MQRTLVSDTMVMVKPPWPRFLERTDFSARIAYVDYNGTKVLQNYLDNKPKSSSERLEFVKSNAPKIVAGIEMIGRFFENLRKEPFHDSQIPKSLMITSS